MIRDTIEGNPQKKKILYLTSRFPYPLDKGDKLRAFHQIKALSTSYDVILCAINDEFLTKQDIESLQPFTSQINIFSINIWSRLFQILKSIFTNIPFQVSWFYNENIESTLQKIINTSAPDIIFVQLTRMAKYKFDSSAYKILDYMDAFGESMNKRAKISSFWLKFIYNIEAKKIIHFEKKVHTRFQMTYIISNQDKQLFDRSISDSISILPNGIDTLHFNPIESNKIFELGFIGNMSYLPNIEAAMYLVRNILPLLPTNTKVLIAGATPDAKVVSLSSKNVEVSGWMEDIRIAYSTTHIFVAPIFSGTGQQNKIIEAMAMGTPVVTTKSVADGINCEINIHLLVAETSEEFAMKIKLLQNDRELYNTIRSNALSFVGSKYDWKQIIEKISLLPII